MVFSVTVHYGQLHALVVGDRIVSLQRTFLVSRNTTVSVTAAGCAVIEDEWSPYG